MPKKLIGPNHRPTHRLKVRDKRTGRDNTVGLGWLREDGMISLALLPCIVLRDDPEILLGLFPVDYMDVAPDAETQPGQGPRGPGGAAGPEAAGA